MRLTLGRFDFRENSTIGHLYINKGYFCDICEDKDRGLDSKMPKEQLEKMKIKGVTAIPYGTYEIVITWSPRFKRMLPLLKEVPVYEGVRIHTGNKHQDTDGCLLTGKDTKQGTVSNSRYWFNKFMPILEAGLKEGRVFIDIVKEG